MASQSAVKKMPAAAKSDENQPVKKARQPRVFDYSRYRVTIQNPDEFQRYLSGYPNKTGLMAYVYRLVPKIDLSLIGRETTNILETAEFHKVTPAAIAEDFGRGKYMVTLNDSNRPKGEKEVCKGIYRLEDEAKPPVYDIRTLLLNHPDNMDEVNRLIATGVLVRDAGNGSPKLKTEADRDPVPVASNGNGGGELLSRDVLGQVLLKIIAAGTQSPDAAVKQALDIAKFLQPPASAQSQLTVDQIAELVSARLERTLGKANSDGDLFQAYERVGSFIEKVRGPSTAVTVGEGASGWTAVLGMLLERVDRWAPQIIQAVQLRSQQPPPRQNGHRRPAAVPNAQQPAEQEQVTLGDRIVQIASLGFQKMNEGVNGFDYAAFVCNYQPGGLEVYRLLEPQGPAGVMGLAAMNPQTAPFLTEPAKRAQVEAFLSDFFSFDPDGSQESELQPMGAGSESGAERTAAAVA
jgi:hypothetical protein